VRLSVLHQVLRSVILEHLSMVEHEDFVTFYNRVESVSDRDYCGLCELLLDELLNLLFRNDVDIGGCLIEDHHTVLPQDCPADAN